MKKNKTKKEIVRMLLNQQLDEKDEEELMDLLINQPISVDVDKEDEENVKFKDRLADKISQKAGSWGFILGFSIFLILWILINTYMANKVDPYPFILLNLFLSCLAALQAPIIMMSQNRAAEKYRMRSQNDYRTNLKSELLLEELHDHIEQIRINQEKILAILKEKSEK